MGQAFDRDGNVLGEAYGATKREVFEKLDAAHKDAERIEIQKVRDRVMAASARDNAIDGLLRLLEGVRSGVGQRRDGVAPVVDALIDAARSSESAHTRALDVRGTTGGKATTETSGT